MDDQSIEEANALGDIGFVTEYNGRSTGFRFNSYCDSRGNRL
jgi:hypothetical protein